LYISVTIIYFFNLFSFASNYHQSTDIKTTPAGSRSPLVISHGLDIYEVI